MKITREKIIIKEENITSKKFDEKFDEGFDEFLRYCKIRNLRPATIKHYTDIVNYSFYKFLDYKFKTYKIEINLINSKLIDSYILWQKEHTKQNPTTINTNLKGIRTIVYYFIKLGYTQDFKMVLMEVDKPIIETYTDAELKILLAKPDLNKCNFLEYRNYVFVNFCMGTGARLSTLVNIKIENLDFENELIEYKHTKNRKGQIVPMSSTLKKILIEYLQYRKPKTQEDYLFCNAYGQQLKTNLISQNLAHYNRKRGVMKTGIHRFRHTFAKKWILNGGDIFRLQKMLSHSDMRIVKNYVEMFTTDLQTDFNQFNPLESLTEQPKKSIKLK